MPSRLSPLKIGVPTLPPIPYPGQTDFHNWVHQLYVELEIYFNKMKDQLVDSRGFLLVARQGVEDGFSIEPSAHYVDAFHDPVAVTSSATAAIASGVGEQQIIVTNASGGNLTLKGGAQTFPLTDVVLAPLEAATYRWDDFNKVWVRIIMT